MALRLVQVNFKAADDAALGRFWADALGWETSSEGPGVTNVEPRGNVWPDPAALTIDVVSVPDPGSVHYRAHLELATTSAEHRAELIAHLSALGATSAGEDGELADPDGTLFRVLEPQPLYADTGPIAAVVVACDDPRALAAFWDAAIDWTLHELGDDLARFRSAAGVGPYLELRRAASPAELRTRVHLDVVPYAGDDQAAEVARLRALGAIETDIGQGEVSWAVLSDTEGNEFCVLSPH
jgi:predicted enzyme related to lactoylglutathione lyase